MIFFIQGHPNVLATHQTTLEFTKDKDLTKKGDCILGVGADFSYQDLKAFVSEKQHFVVRISANGVTDEFTADINKDFSDQHEIVIRKTGFLSSRTLGINSSKAAFEVNRKIVETLKIPDARVKVEFI